MLPVFIYSFIYLLIIIIVVVIVVLMFRMFLILIIDIVDDIGILERVRKLDNLCPILLYKLFHVPATGVTNAVVCIILSVG